MSQRRPARSEILLSPVLGAAEGYHDVGLQTTDPSVFDGDFLYTVCQQPTFCHLLKHLGRGSVILFGSRREMRFTLDTLFVVRDWIDHDAENYTARLSGRRSPMFEAVTLGPLARQPLPGTPRPALTMSPVADRGPTYRLYFGTSVTEPVVGMFSFFPCLLYSTAPGGFSCPFIDLPGLALDGGDVVKHGKCAGREFEDAGGPKEFEDCPLDWKDGRATEPGCGPWWGGAEAATVTFCNGLLVRAGLPRLTAVDGSPEATFDTEGVNAELLDALDRAEWRLES